MKPLLRPAQRAALDEMKAACAECAGHIDILKGIGITLDDREVVNASRQASCDHCEAVAAEYSKVAE